MDTAGQTGPLAAYRDALAAGRLEPDAQQARAAERLQALHQALDGYRPPAAPQPGLAPALVRRLLNGLGLAQSRPVPRGLYLHGGTGRGKSMLMDLFFAKAPLRRKRRAHFQSFMLEFHDSVHRWRLAEAAAGRPAGDPILPQAERIARDSWLLCFDEFQVTNIADAMILGRLFTALFERGVVVVATSNQAPDALYRRGLQRELFLPFIALLKQRLEVLKLDGARDWRLARLGGTRVYHTPADAAAERALAAAFDRLTDGADGSREQVEVQGRRLVVPRAARGVAWFGFAELCGRPLGAADYLALAGRYHTLILSGIPVLPPDRRDEAQRLIALVDALYENRCKLVASAAAAPDHLCPSGPAAEPFRRTASRLAEMQAEDYLALPHAARDALETETGSMREMGP